MGVGDPILARSVNIRLLPGCRDLSGPFVILGIIKIYKEMFRTGERRQDLEVNVTDDDFIKHCAR